MDDDMKINTTTVKRMRNDRAWSQEQLAEIANVSLRTIQRVEAEGSASRETRMAIAAAFGIDVRELAVCDEAPPQAQAHAQATPAPPAITPARYRHAGLAALGAATALCGALYFRFDSVPLAVINLLLLTAIVATMYAGFGWYFSGRAPLATCARRTVQFGFIFGAIALLFCSVSPSPKTAALSALQLMLFSCAIHLGFEAYRSRKAKSQGPGSA